MPGEAGSQCCWVRTRLIPGRQSCAYDGASLLATGRSDPAPSVAAIGAWKGGPRVGGPRSRRPAVTVAVEAPATAVECGDRRKAHGRRRARKSRPPAAACSGVQNRRHAGAARQPRGPRQVPEGPLEGPSSRPGRVCWGRRSTGPRVADKGARVPVAPRATPRGPRERNGACLMPSTRPPQPDAQDARCRQCQTGTADTPLRERRAGLGGGLNRRRRSASPACAASYRASPR